MGLRKKSRRKARSLLRNWGIFLPAGLLLDDEPFIRSVARHLQRKDLVLDLGAHIGRASIEFSHFAGAVHSFEPHPEIFKELRHNTRNYHRVKAINKAVSDVTGQMKLYFEPPKPGKFYEGSSLVTTKSNLSYENAFDVETVALAEYVEGLGKPVRMIKMDIEGAEYQVLSALIETPAIGQIEKIYVEDHCDRVAGLSDMRDRCVARIEALGLTNRFDFTWP